MQSSRGHGSGMPGHSAVDERGARTGARENISWPSSGAADDEGGAGALSNEGHDEAGGEAAGGGHPWL